MYICENCKKEHDGLFASGRFCSKKCSRAFSTKANRKEINEKVSKKLLKKPKILICPICTNEFITKKSTQKYCSKSCAIKQRGGWKNALGKLTKEDWSRINKASYANGHNYVAGGTTKWYEYKDIKVQGTYELRTCKILDIWKQYNVIKDWEYTNDKVQYIGEDKKEHTYLLDFKVITNEGLNYYIEVKGYETPNDILKWKAVREMGNRLEVWFEKDIIKLETGSIV